SASRSPCSGARGPPRSSGSSGSPRLRGSSSPRCCWWSGKEDIWSTTPWCSEQRRGSPRPPPRRPLLADYHLKAAVDHPLAVEGHFHLRRLHARIFHHLFHSLIAGLL